MICMVLITHIIISHDDIQATNDYYGGGGGVWVFKYPYPAYATSDCAMRSRTKAAGINDS